MKSANIPPQNKGVKSLATQLGDQDQTRLALACLFASLAQTLGEQDRAFVPKFEQHLDRMYAQVKDYEPAHGGARNPSLDGRDVEESFIKRGP